MSATPASGSDGAATTIAEIDKEFQQVGCLGHGGFGSVFLGSKASGRQVALKFVRFELDADIEEEQELFCRELDAVLRLDGTGSGSNEGNRDLAIVFFEDWFTGPNFAAFVMNYADGGTLADEVVSHSGENCEPYTERRIAFYASQLSEALAFAHQRGVAHHDVKSANVLIDRTGGGKLLLADFGSAIAPGEESIKFTEIYASPELQAAYARDNFSGLQADKIDAFGLGCIIYEMLCCQKLIDLGQEQTLGEFIGAQQNSPDAALDLPCVRLKWLPESKNGTSPAAQSEVGYSNALRGLVKTLLEPNPVKRWSPMDLQKSFRQDPLSPLLAQFVTAAQSPQPGAPLTIDNIQLGMFIQRGRDWNEGDADGGADSVGIVVKLDADAGYTEVAFPTRAPSVEPKPVICRIGAGNKFELQVGPTPLNDFLGQTRSTGIIHCDDTSMFSAGQIMNHTAMIMSIQQTEKIVLVAPMTKIHIPTLSTTLPYPAPVAAVSPRKPLPPPDTWEADLGLLVEVSDVDERSLVVAPFYAIQGGLDTQNYEILSIKRNQSEQMWTVYATWRESVAAENWGVVNEQRLFHGTGRHSPEVLLVSPGDFHQNCTAAGTGGSPNEICFTTESKTGDRFSYKGANPNARVRQMVVSRVALGRVDEQRSNEQREARPPCFCPLEYHSVREEGAGGKGYAIGNPLQAFPEYIITYQVQSTRRMVKARRPLRGGRSSSVARARIPPRPRQQISPQAATPQAMPVQIAATQVPGAQHPMATLSTPAASKIQAATRTPGSSASVAKECAICMERNVTHILVPCGHPLLCEICSTSQGLVKLGHKCPLCRKGIREAIRFYGKIVED